MTSFDPLEETVGASDISGRNNCPMHLRITAIGMLPLNERRTYLGVTLKSFVYDFYPGQPKRAWISGKKKPVWAIIEGEIVMANTMAELSRIIKKNYTSLFNNKKIAESEGQKETTISGIRYGWGDPPNPIDK